jgi:hypothetical protein
VVKCEQLGSVAVVVLSLVAFEDQLWIVQTNLVGVDRVNNDSIIR